MNEMISVIMPVYNVEKYLKKSIESILSQTYQNFELLVVDDGSPDNSSKIINEYAKKDSRVKLLSKLNGGLSDARNFGLKFAKGDFIYFIDSDDYIEPDLLEKTLCVALKENADVVIFGYFIDYVDLQENIYKSIEILNINRTYSSYLFNQIYIDQNLLKLLGYAWNKLYKHQYIKELNHKFITGISLVEDILFNEIILSQAKNISFIDEKLYHYIQRKRDTLGSTFYYNSYELQLKAIDARKNILKAWNTSSLILQKNIIILEIDAIRFCCTNLFYQKNQLTFFDKYRYLKYMTDLFNKRVSGKNFEVENKKDKFLLYLIQKKLNLFISLIYLLNSKKRKEFLN